MTDFQKCLLLNANDRSISTDMTPGEQKQNWIIFQALTLRKKYHISHLQASYGVTTARYVDKHGIIMMLDLYV